MLKIKFIGNSDILDVTKNSSETMIVSHKEMLGIWDLRATHYHRIKHGILQQNLSKYIRRKIKKQ